MKLKSLLEKLYDDTDNQPASQIAYPDPVPTPSHGLNWAINGGIRPGAFYCFEGPEQSGKSFMALCCVAELLHKNPEGMVIWYDVEGSFSNHFASLLLSEEERNRLVVRRGSTGSAIFDYFRDNILGLVDQGLQVVGCVVDSVSSIVPPKLAVAKSTEDHIMGDLSAYLPKALGLINQPCRPRLKEGFLGIPWIFISQVRDNLDPSAIYTGKKYRSPGGRAAKHYYDVNILFEQIESKKAKIFNENLKNMNDSSMQIGHRVRAKVQKNRLGPPARIVEFDIEYDKGIVNQAEEIANLGLKLGIITKEGNTYSHNGKKLGVGEENAIKAVSNSKEIQEELIQLIMKRSTNEEAFDSGRFAPEAK